MTATPTAEQGAFVQSLQRSIGAADFEEWYNKRLVTENIKAGKPYLNTPPPVTPPEQHSPSQLNQCHRKIYYRQLNAPEETEDPNGIFWTGSKIEEEVLMPYLESVVDGVAYIRNSMWVDYTVETAVCKIRIRGSTDPVIVDKESKPILPTEIKTKKSIDRTAEPNEHHLAQLYAYMEGLSQEWDTDVRQGMIIYCDRTDLTIKAFEISFDRKRWSRLVQEWAERHTEYRLNDELPPADPVFQWECNFCSFKHRCGKGEATSFEDEEATGFLPGFEYPGEKVESYLQSHSGAKLTPTLAATYPGLAEQYEVYEWRCEAGTHTFAIDEVEWDRNTGENPVCPVCVTDEVLSELVEPGAGEQDCDIDSDPEVTLP